ncbi:hypothetical protein BJ508DRAFT_96298 [Ascobolus immersus RN42]|uniref:Uncharacterized protein n=1 Tax=Ascobolus immersus RN42 TaxID=1160509 RepID=A0A3N4ILY2_ASCIM|nr:hypothetical protein BJ508DRAFT_96298 [Ascobolus immersus RN42]
MTLLGLYKQFIFALPAFFFFHLSCLIGSHFWHKVSFLLRLIYSLHFLFYSCISCRHGRPPLLTVIHRFSLVHMLLLFGLFFRLPCLAVGHVCRIPLHARSFGHGTYSNRWSCWKLLWLPVDVWLIGTATLVFFLRVCFSGEGVYCSGGVLPAYFGLSVRFHGSFVLKINSNLNQMKLPRWFILGITDFQSFWLWICVSSICCSLCCAITGVCFLYRLGVIFRVFLKLQFVALCLVPLLSP